MATKKSTNLINAILYIAIGILFCLQIGLELMLTIAGVVFLVLGIIDLIKKHWFSGAISVFIGAIILLGANLFINIVMLVFGILIAIKGLISLIESIRRKRALDLIFAVLTLVAGVLIALNTGTVITWVMIVVGVVMIIDGVLGLISALTSKKK